MAKELKVGPLLGLESDNLYTVCFLAKKGLENLRVVCGDAITPAEMIEETPSGRFFRAELAVPIPEEGTEQSYSVHSDAGVCQDAFGRSEWTFHVPAGVSHEEIRIAYASCNGFSADPGPSKGAKSHYALWESMREQHRERPLSVLIMGGDQLYADEIWTSKLCSTIEDWNELDYERRIDANVTKTMRKQLGVFYESLYLRHWQKEDMAFMMASVPTLMMWDDHDIFDGWGSYPKELQECDVYQAIYQEAARHFELFQIRSRHNGSLLDASAPHFSFALEFRGHGVLALDNRSERSLTPVMSARNWNAVKGWLDSPDRNGLESLLVLSAVPVVYRSFACVESVMGASPWQEELEDDVRDHWTSDRHEGEREKLIMNLLSFKERIQPGKGYVVILSGDVHVGSVGVVDDRRDENHRRQIQQVVSSAIVHPPPGWAAWEGLKLLTGDRREKLEGAEVFSETLRPLGGGKFIRARNYATLEVGSDDKFWVEWVCDDGNRREFGIAKS
jgi:hypothetical protein